MSVQGVTAVHNAALTLRDPTHAPATLATDWDLMGDRALSYPQQHPLPPQQHPLPLRQTVVVDSLGPVAVSRHPDGLTTTHSGTSSASGLWTSL